MTTTSTSLPGGTTPLGDRVVSRIGYGAMQLAGPGVMGPPADRDAALAVLRRAVELGITHIDTSDAYGPATTNRLIHEALHPYPADLVLATKVGAVRDAEGGWPPARTPGQVRDQVHDNLDSLGVERLDLVNLRLGDAMGPVPESVAPALEALVDLQQDGLVGLLGLSNATPAQVAEARSVTSIVCVQNHYNLANRTDDALVDQLAAEGIAYVPFFPLGGFSPLQSAALDAVAARHGTSAHVVALAWLLQRSPTMLLIPGTSSVAHLEANVASADLVLTETDVVELDGIATASG